MAYNNEPMTDFEEDINWDSVGGTAPEGKYDLEVVEAAYRRTKSNKHMVVMQFAIESAYDSANEEGSKNRRVFENMVFTATAAFRVKDYAKACGAELPDRISQSVLEEWAQAQVGTKVGATLKHQPDLNGEPRAQVRKFFTYGTGGEAAAEGEETEEVQETQEEQQEEPEAQAAPEPEPAPAAPPPRQTLRDAVTQQKLSNGKNGHTSHANGVNGAAKKPKPKEATKTARR